MKTSREWDTYERCVCEQIESVYWLWTLLTCSCFKQSSVNLLYKTIISVIIISVIIVSVITISVIIVSVIVIIIITK